MHLWKTMSRHTANELATVVGVSSCELSRWSAGTVEPNYESRKKIASASKELVSIDSWDHEFKTAKVRVEFCK